MLKRSKTQREESEEQPAFFFTEPQGQKANRVTKTKREGMFLRRKKLPPTTSGAVGGEAGHDEQSPRQIPSLIKTEEVTETAARLLERLGKRKSARKKRPREKSTREDPQDVSVSVSMEAATSPPSQETKQHNAFSKTRQSTVDQDRSQEDSFTDGSKLNEECVLTAPEIPLEALTPPPVESEDRASSYLAEQWIVPQVRDVYEHEEPLHPVYYEDEALANGESLGESLPRALSPLFSVSDPVARDSRGSIVEREDDYEEVFVLTGGKRGRKRKKKKKPEKQIVKLTPKSFSDQTKSRQLHAALGIQNPETEGDKYMDDADPTGRRTLAGVRDLAAYDMMEYPQDDAFAYNRPEEYAYYGEGLSREEEEEHYESGSSSSGEDIEEAVHRIIHGKGTMSALTVDGSAPRGIFLGLTEEERQRQEEEQSGSGTSSCIPTTDGTSTVGSKQTKKKGKRGRKSEGLDIHRVPFNKVVLAEDLWDAVNACRNRGRQEGLPGEEDIHTDRQSGRNLPRGKKIQGIADNQDLMIRTDPIRSEMMRTTNRRNSTTGAYSQQSQGIPVVSPLTKVKQMFMHASRVPEEAAVLARAREMDDIQASIRFGNLNESEVHIESNIREFVQCGKVDDVQSPQLLLHEESIVEEGNRKDAAMFPPSSTRDSFSPLQRDGSSMEEPKVSPTGSLYYTEYEEREVMTAPMPSITRMEIPDTQEAYSVLSLDVDTSERGIQGASLLVPDISRHEDSEDEDEDEGQRERKEEESRAEEEPRPRLLCDEMQRMTERMVKHEKRVKKIVSDKHLFGLSTMMMKGTVLDIFMYDILECIRKRPNESVILTNGKILRGNSMEANRAASSSLRMANAYNIVWKERDIFSLCSQLVDLQEERKVYREIAMGMGRMWQDMDSDTKRSILGDACDVSYCGRYMRPPVGFERPCVWETECVCYLMGQAGIFPDTLDRVVSDTAFIGREFYTPDKDKLMKNRAWPKKRRSCMICYDIAMLFAYYYYKRNNKDAPFLLMNHWNKVEGENAYSPAQCFPLIDNDKRWTGFIAPKVMRVLTSFRSYEMNVRVNGTMKTVPCFVEACQDFW